MHNCTIARVPKRKFRDSERLLVPESITIVAGTAVCCNVVCSAVRSGDLKALETFDPMHLDHSQTSSALEQRTQALEQHTHRRMLVPRVYSIRLGVTAVRTCPVVAGSFMHPRAQFPLSPAAHASKQLFTSAYMHTDFVKFERRTSFRR
jgi:hypothetical protein